MIKNKKVISWWSGGITSAVTCKLCIDIFGLKNVDFIFIDTQNEDEDTYRFMNDCEKWYGKKIDTISAIPDKYKSIEDVWRRHKSLNVATGAICSSELKKQVRIDWQKTNNYDHQAFGFEFTLREMKRAFSIRINYPDTKAIFPLIFAGMTKKECGEIIRGQGIELPRMYQLGFHNNNCFNTGCVQGGIGYWQKMKRDFPDKFNRMAEMEHELTDAKGKPVTMLKDQSIQAKESGNILVFLKAHPDYPELKSIDDMKEQKIEPLFECNGFCGTNDLLEKQPTEGQLNFDFD